jgi:hypothetical protein
MLKKLLLITTILSSSYVTIAQTTLSQTNNAVPTDTTVACAVGQNPSVGISASSYFRAYTMNSNTKIVSVKVGVGAVTGSFPIVVKLYKSTGNFPGSYPANLALLTSVNATITTTDNLSLYTVQLTSPLEVLSGDIIVAEISNVNTAPSEGGNGSLHYMGTVTSQTAPGYLLASGCSINTPTSFITIDPDAKIIIDLFVDPTASSEEFFNSNFALYPNPVNDVLNVESKNGMIVNEITISDLSGKVVNSVKNTSSVNVSSLATGTYIINIDSNEGKATSKFLKK